MSLDRGCGKRRGMSVRHADDTRYTRQEGVTAPCRHADQDTDRSREILSCP